jgi:molybdopterin-guanine dinucleotide biosynthesis protein A
LPACQYNPFEVAVCGPNSEIRASLIAALTAHYEKLHTVGQVMMRDPQMMGETVESMGTSLIVGDGQHGLMYPEHLDEYLGPRPLLDADLVLVESSQNPDMPKLVAVHDAPLDQEYSDVLAYVGISGVSAILDSNVIYFALLESADIIAEVDAFLDAKANRIPLNGLILAGGLSTRMGRDKGTLDYHGKSQIAHCHELLSPFCERVFISSRTEQQMEYAQTGFDYIPDAFVGIGPMGGILSALRSDPTAAWLVLACDLPFVTDTTLETLVRNRNPFKLATAYLSANDGLPEPLCAIYEPKSVHRLMAFLARGYQCPRKVLINSDTKLIEAPENGELDNVNRPEEYEAARNALRQSQ